MLKSLEFETTLCYHTQNRSLENSSSVSTISVPRLVDILPKSLESCKLLVQPGEEGFHTVRQLFRGFAEMVGKHHSLPNLQKMTTVYCGKTTPFSKEFRDRGGLGLIPLRSQNYVDALTLPIMRLEETNQPPKPGWVRSWKRNYPFHDY